MPGARRDADYRPVSLKMRPAGDFECNGLLTTGEGASGWHNGRRMTYRVAVVLALIALFLPVTAQEPSDCPPRAVINNGVCIGKDGSDCSKEAQLSICYAADPQYTDEAAKADLSAATVERDAIPLAFLCWSLTNVTRFSRSGSRLYCRRKHFPCVCPL